MKNTKPSSAHHDDFVWQTFYPWKPDELGVEQAYSWNVKDQLPWVRAMPVESQRYLQLISDPELLVRDLRSSLSMVRHWGKEVEHFLGLVVAELGAQILAVSSLSSADRARISFEFMTLAAIMCKPLVGVTEDLPPLSEEVDRQRTTLRIALDDDGKNLVLGSCGASNEASPENYLNFIAKSWHHAPQFKNAEDISLVERVTLPQRCVHMLAVLGHKEIRSRLREITLNNQNAGLVFGQCLTPHYLLVASSKRTASNHSVVPSAQVEAKLVKEWFEVTRGFLAEHESQTYAEKDDPNLGACWAVQIFEIVWSALSGLRWNTRPVLTGLTQPGFVDAAWRSWHYPGLTDAVKVEDLLWLTLSDEMLNMECWQSSSSVQNVDDAAFSGLTALDSTKQGKGLHLAEVVNILKQTCIILDLWQRHLTTWSALGHQSGGQLGVNWQEQCQMVLGTRDVCASLLSLVHAKAAEYPKPKKEIVVFELPKYAPDKNRIPASLILEPKSMGFLYQIFTQTFGRKNYQSNTSTSVVFDLWTEAFRAVKLEVLPAQRNSSRWITQFFDDCLTLTDIGDDERFAQFWIAGFSALDKVPRVGRELLAIIQPALERYEPGLWSAAQHNYFAQVLRNKAVDQPEVPKLVVAKKKPGSRL